MQRAGSFAHGSAHSVARGGVAAFAIFAGGVGLTYAAQVFIAWVAGAETFGVFVYTQAWVTLLAAICALGFDVALLRFVPQYLNGANWPLIAGIARYAARAAFGAGALVTLVGVAAVCFWPHGAPAAQSNALAIGLIAVPLWSLMLVRCSLTRAFGGVVLAIAPDRIVRDGALIVFVAFAILALRLRVSAELLVACMVLSTAAGLGVATFAERRLRPIEARAARPVFDAADWRKATLPIFLIGVAEIFMNRTGVLLLGHGGAIKDAGIYGLVFNIAFVVTLPRTAINTLLAPTIASLFAQGERAALQELIKRSSLWMLWSCAAIALALFVFADPILRVLGADFESGATALRILLVGQAFAAANGSQLHTMTMTAYERNAAILLIAAAALNLVLGAILIAWLGMTGAAIAMTASLIAWNIAMAIFLYRSLQLWPGVLAALSSVFSTRIPGSGAVAAAALQVDAGGMGLAKAPNE